MKTQAVLFSSPGVVETCSVDLPELGPREIITEAIVSAISPGTELRMLQGHYGTAGKFPYVPGYNAISRVVEIGSAAKEWRVGDLVRRGGKVGRATAAAGRRGRVQARDRG